jgi:hypothetical protein
LADASLAETLKKFVLVHIDLTDPPKGSPAEQAAAKYGIRSIPDLRILGADGSVKSMVESRSAADLVKELNAALGK